MDWAAIFKLINETEISLLFVKGNGLGAFLIFIVVLILIFRSKRSAMERIISSLANIKRK